MFSGTTHKNMKGVEVIMFNDDVIQSEDSYTHFKDTIEKLRRFALKFKVSIVSATQETGVSDSDYTCSGLMLSRLNTTDLMLGLVFNKN